MSHRISTTIVLFAAVVALSAIAPVASGQACTCPAFDPREGIERSDAAFVGALESFRPSPNGSIVMVYRVDQVLKGTMDESIEIDFPARSCGTAQPIDVAVGLLVFRRGDRWISSPCAQVDPATLVAATAPLPHPNGQPAPVVFAGGAIGEPRTIGIDDAGRITAYGLGPGETQALSVCPGGERVVEVATDPFHSLSATITVRATSTLDALSEDQLPPSMGAATSYTVACLDRQAMRALVLERGTDYSRILSVDDGVVDGQGTTQPGPPPVIAAGDGYSVTAQGDTAVRSAGGNEGDPIGSVGSDIIGLAAGPDPNVVAALSESRVFLIGGGAVMASSEAGTGAGDVHWASPDSIVVSRDSGEIVIFNRQLARMRSSTAPPATVSAVAGMSLFRAGEDLLDIDLNDGALRVRRSGTGVVALATEPLAPAPPPPPSTAAPPTTPDTTAAPPGTTAPPTSSPTTTETTVPPSSTRPAGAGSDGGGPGILLLVLVPLFAALLIVPALVNRRSDRPADGARPGPRG